MGNVGGRGGGWHVCLRRPSRICKVGDCHLGGALCRSEIDCLILFYGGGEGAFYLRRELLEIGDSSCFK